MRRRLAIRAQAQRASVNASLGGEMKKKALLLCASLLAVLALQGCATIRGMGEDLQSLGRAIQRTVSR